MAPLPRRRRSRRRALLPLLLAATPIRAAQTFHRLRATAVAATGREGYHRETQRPHAWRRPGAGERLEAATATFHRLNAAADRSASHSREVAVARTPHPSETSHGPCPCGKHGSCLVDECWCDPGWRGPSCKERHPYHWPPLSSCSDRKANLVNDACMNLAGGWGRLRTYSSSRYHIAGQCEKSWWQRTRIPERNQFQVNAFNKFSALPTNLGDVLEVGAGPYTKLRLILESGNYSRTLKSVTLEDPLASDYIANPKIVTSYDEHQFCIPGQRCWPLNLIRVGAEVPFQTEAYDTVIMMNVLEHCMDAVLVLSNVYKALRPGGVLVFSDTVYSPGSLPSSDACHPLRITSKFFQYYMNTFFKRGGRILMQQRISGGMFNIVVEKPVTRAPRESRE